MLYIHRRLVLQSAFATLKAGNVERRWSCANQTRQHRRAASEYWINRRIQGFGCRLSRNAWYDRRPARESAGALFFVPEGPERLSTGNSPPAPQGRRILAVDTSMNNKKRLLPLGIKNPIKTELPALVGLEAIGKPWFNETHRSDLLAVALVSQVIAPPGSYIYVIADELIALLQGDDLKIDEVRPLVMDMSAWLQVQPNGRVDQAIDQLLKPQKKQHTSRRK